MIKEEMNKEVGKIRSLMERMDKPMHYLDALNREIGLIKEASNDVDRIVNGDKFGSYIGKIGKGWKVHVGYVTREALSLSRTYPSVDSYNKLSSELEKGGEEMKRYMGNSAQDMNNYLTNPGKRKTFAFPIQGDYEVIKYQEYKMNWMDRPTLAAFYDTQREKEMRLRQQYGFGKEGAEDTWRNKSTIYKSGDKEGQINWKYGGSGLIPIVDKEGNKYNDSTGEEGFHDSWRDIKTGKYSLRQDAKAEGEPKYFLRNKETGAIEVIGNDLMKLLSKGFKAPSVEKVKEELEADEMEFVQLLNAIKKETSKVWNLLEDNCLYISYSTNGEDDNQHRRYVNQELKSMLKPVLPTLGIDSKLASTEE